MLIEQQLFADRYRLIKRLGQGAFSEVWRAEDTKAGNLTVALKVYAPEKGLDENGAKTFSEEFSLVFNMSHPNLLTPTYFDDYHGSPYLVLPFCERGSALNLVGTANEDTVAHFLYDVSSALAYLHERGVIHQDIKPDNVLIDSAGSFKVTDFGISTKMRSTLRRSVGDKKGAGTMAYMGPERFSRTPETIMASDVWSLGATVYELMSGDVPFGDLGGGMQKGGAEIPEVRGDYPAKLKELVEKCLAKETWNRPTAAQIRDACNTRIQKGYWDLLPLQSAAKTDPKHRPTVKKVDVPVDLSTPSKPRPEPKHEPKSEPKPQTNDKEGGNKKILLIVVALAVVGLGVFLLIPKESSRWKKIQYTGTFQEYYDFCQKYPDGKHASEARKAMLDAAKNTDCVECLKEIATRYSDHYEGAEARGYLVAAEDKAVSAAVTNAKDAAEQIKSKWTDFSEAVNDCNSALDRLNDVRAQIGTLMEYGVSEGQCAEWNSRINQAESQMLQEIQSKIDGIQQNIRMGSTEEKPYLDQLRAYNGL